MASFTYDDFRVALKRAGFEKLRSEKHETWRKFLPNGSILRVASATSTNGTFPSGCFTKCFDKRG